MNAGGGALSSKNLTVNRGNVEILHHRIAGDLVGIYPAGVVSLKSCWLGIAAGGFILCLEFGLAMSARAAAPRLEVPGVSAGQVTLKLLGEAGQSYRVEGSGDLKNWVEVGAGVAAGGVLTLNHPRLSGEGSYYYRGVLVGGTSYFPTVSPVASTNLIAVTVAAPGVEGFGQIAGPNDVVYTATIPSNAVFDSVPVQMTVLTAVNGVPARNGFLAGVRFEPEGLVLTSPFFLNIDFPTNIPASQVSSYAFGNDGGALHLVPDVVVSNRVRILVTQLRSYACGVFTLSELAAQASTVPRPAAPARPALHASMEECYPDDEREAAAMRKELEDRIRPYQQHAAAVLGEERQKQLLGGSEAEGMSALLGVLSDAEQFYQQELKSRIPAAKQTCAKSRELIPWILGHERQKALLGANDGDGAMDTATLDLICGGMRRCQEQAIDCCRTKGGDTRLIQFLLGIERQRQLLGMGEECGSAVNLAEVSDECAPKWFGSLTVTQSGSVSTNRSSNPQVYISRLSESWSYTLSATVVSTDVRVQEPFLIFPGYTNLTFHLTGKIEGKHQLLDEYEDLWDPCGGGSQRALAGVRKHDGGEALKRRVEMSSQVEKEVKFDITAQILAPGTGGFGITAYLNIVTPSESVPFEGFKTDVLKIVESTGCVTEDNSGPVKSVDTYGGAAFSREAGEFEYTSDMIRFLRRTPKKVGEVALVEELKFEVQRIK